MTRQSELRPAGPDWSSAPVPLAASLRRSVARAVPMELRRRRWYYREFGRHFRSSRAETFTDKVNWRILHDRRPLLVRTCDKLWMKEHALATAPGLVRVPETYWAGTDLAGLADVELPERWVLKPNHSSQRVVLGEGPADIAALTRQTTGWLADDLARRTGEWAYRHARPLLLVEEFIGEPGQTPPDYKVYVFDGVPRLVQVHSSRFTVHRSRIYTTDWEPRPWSAGYPLGPDVPRPERADEMFRAASLLAEGFDMLRVDFYEHEGVLWFGETTPYPGAGMVKVDPEMDAFLGKWWRLPDTTRWPLRARASAGSTGPAA